MAKVSKNQYKTVVPKKPGRRTARRRQAEEELPKKRYPLRAIPKNVGLSKSTGISINRYLHSEFGFRAAAVVLPSRLPPEYAPFT